MSPNRPILKMANLALEKMIASKKQLKFAAIKVIAISHHILKKLIVIMIM